MRGSPLSLQAGRGAVRLINTNLQLALKVTFVGAIKRSESRRSVESSKSSLARLRKLDTLTGRTSVKQDQEGVNINICGQHL